MEDMLYPRTLDISKITYGAVKPYGTSGGKSIFMAHNKKGITLQTPKMYCPFNLSKWDKKEKDKNGEEKASFKFDLLLSLNKPSPDEITEEDDTKLSNLTVFTKKLMQLDDKLITDGIEHSMNWLGKKITSKEVISELYTPCVKWSRDKNTDEIIDKYPPNFKVTIPYKNGQFDCEAYTGDLSNPTKIDLSQVNLQKSYVTAIVQCTGIWVVGKKYGTTWKVAQIMVEPKMELPKMAFRSIENDNPSKKPSADEEEDEIHDGVEAGSDEIIEDSDDELEAKKK